MPIPEPVVDLIERYRRNSEDYENPRYNETQTRREFLDPLFKALGWDIDNALGYAEAYKDVIHEDALRVGVATKAPDYCFRVGGARKFFLEAKKPAIRLKDDTGPAYQLRRYAWSAKLPLSILSNFRELAVYDCRTRPSPDERASTARIHLWTFEQYENLWDDIAAIFSKDAILKGSFDKYAETTTGRRGTAEVDDAFLEEIEAWRSSLARNIALRNPNISSRELNYSVQQTIDRIVFLRICEDRAIEPYGRLQKVSEEEGIYERLTTLFHQADDRYNSGLFHFRREKDRQTPPDELTLSLRIDDKVLKDILGRLYYPESPYEFSVLPADILGQVYEQFLGSVIRLTEGGHAKIEAKPDVKKAGGVYYTPTYVVDYIIRQTVGVFLNNRNLKTLKRLAIVDPACGSGSFLLGAYQYLLDWYLQQYVSDDPVSHARSRKPKVFQSAKSTWRLTTSERKRILIEHIYGVDVDSQAVEVTKLSLLLKVLETESAETLGRNFELFHERALPDLDANIKCGNSLIGPGFYTSRLQFEDSELYRINAFSWSDGFPDIMKQGGFDVLIGNPPWGALFSDEELEYLRHVNNPIIVRMIDSFMYFVYQGLHKITKAGYFGMILPDVILYQQDNEKLRLHLLRSLKLQSVLNLGNVFEKVTRPACIVVGQKGDNAAQVTQILDCSHAKKIDKPGKITDVASFVSIKQSQFDDIPGKLFITSGLSNYSIWNKVNQGGHCTLEQLVDGDGIQRGVSPDLKEAFLVDATTAEKWHLEKHKLHPVLTGGIHVKRFAIHRPDLFVIYTSRDDDFRMLPRIRAFVDQYKDKITCKEVKANKHPLYALHRPRNQLIFEKSPKLLGVITEDQIVVALDTERTYATDGLYLFGLKPEIDPLYIMGILNSKLFVFLYRLVALEHGRVLAQVKPTVIATLPIREIDSKSSSDKRIHADMLDAVAGIAALTKAHVQANTKSEQDTLQRQVHALEAKIDSLVYQLYGLTDSEIASIEGG